MITLLTDIPDCIFSKNPSRLQLQTNNYVQTVGQKWAITVNLSGGTPPSGATLLLNILGTVYTFTGFNSPDDSGLQFKNNAANLSTELVNTLNKNYTFQQNYLATYVSPTSFTLRAINYGPLYALSFGGTLSYTTGVATAGINRVYRENFAIIAQLWVELSYNSGDYSLVTTQIQVPNEDSQVLFNFQKNLDAVIGSDIDLPDYGSNTPNYCSYTLRQYYIQYAEQWGNPVVTRKLTNTTIKCVYSGGISFFESIYQPDILITGYLTYAKKFLSFSPYSKVITRSQAEYLFKAFPNPNAITYFTMYVNVYLADNSSVLNIPFYANSTITNYDILYLPVGHDQLDLGTLFPTVPVVRYEVWLGGVIDPNIEYSEKKEYVIDLNTFDDAPQLFYKSSANGVETLRIRSYASKRGNNVTRNLHERYISPYYNLNQGGIIGSTNTEGYTYRQAISGLYSLEWIEHFVREIMHSEAIYEGKDGKYYPVMLLSTDIQHVQDFPGLYSFSFEYRYAASDVVQTPSI